MMTNSKRHKLCTNNCSFVQKTFWRRSSPRPTPFGGEGGQEGQEGGGFTVSTGANHGEYETA